MSVKLSAKLPAGDRDGLQSSEGDLRQERLPILAVVWLYPRSVADVLDHEEDPYLVTLGIKALEVLRGAHAGTGMDLLNTLYEERVGKVPLWDDDERP